MDTTDVDSNANGAQERFTTHIFSQSHFRMFSGSPARIPSDMSIWPPSVLLDAVYASAVASNFGPGLADVLENWVDVFYPDEPTGATDADDNGGADQVGAAQERPEMQRKERHERRNKRQKREKEKEKRKGKRKERARNAVHPLDLVMMYRFMAMEPENVRAYLRGSEEIAAARERKGLEEKVKSWREGVRGTSDVD
jgi:hypothetical protein